MIELFSDIPESIDNTNAIVDKVEVLNLKKDILLPAFPIPKSFQIHKEANMNQWELLKHITWEGAHKRYPEITTELQERLDFEFITRFNEYKYVHPFMTKLSVQVKFIRNPSSRNFLVN